MQTNETKEIRERETERERKQKMASKKGSLPLPGSRASAQSAPAARPSPASPSASTGAVAKGTKRGHGGAELPRTEPAATTKSSEQVTSRSRESRAGHATQESGPGHV